MDQSRYRCLDCDYGCNGSNRLSAHINTNHGSTRAYHDKHFGPGACKGSEELDAIMKDVCHGA